jgi:hypothetical protein
MQFRIMKLTNVIFIKNGKDVTLDDGRVIDNVELTFDPKPPMRYFLFRHSL